MITEHLKDYNSQEKFLRTQIFYAENLREKSQDYSNAITSLKEVIDQSVEFPKIMLDAYAQLILTWRHKYERQGKNIEDLNKMGFCIDDALYFIDLPDQQKHVLFYRLGDWHFLRNNYENSLNNYQKAFTFAIKEQMLFSSSSIATVGEYEKSIAKAHYMLKQYQSAFENIVNSIDDIKAGHFEKSEKWRQNIMLSSSYGVLAKIQFFRWRPSCIYYAGKAFLMSVFLAKNGYGLRLKQALKT